MHTAQPLLPMCAACWTAWCCVQSGLFRGALKHPAAAWGTTMRPQMRIGQHDPVLS